jgi:hypothetical protein
MTRKNWILVVGLLGLVIVYACFFTKAFKPQVIQIHHTTRPRGMIMRTRRAPAAAPLTFGLDGRYQLTEIKAVPLAGWRTNQNILPVWHLVSDSNSVPVNTFVYGQRIPGMQPAVAGARAQPLLTNVVYRLFVTAGNIKGQHDFEIR